MENAYKQYVRVIADFAEDGRLRPLRIQFDGVFYDVDRVLGVRPGYAAKAGGQGDQYTIQVCGQQTRLFFERSTNISGDNIGRWFVERRKANC